MTADVRIDKIDSCNLLQEQGDSLFLGRFASKILLRQSVLFLNGFLLLIRMIRNDNFA